MRIHRIKYFLKISSLSFCSLNQWINSSHSSAEVQFVSAFDSFIINRLYHQNVARLMPICNGSIVPHRKSELKIMPLYLFFMLESRMMSHRNVKCKTLDVRRFSCVNTNVSHMQKVSRHHQCFPNVYYRNICMYAYCIHNKEFTLTISYAIMPLYHNVAKATHQSYGHHYIYIIYLTFWINCTLYVTTSVLNLLVVIVISMNIQD